MNRPRIFAPNPKTSPSPGDAQGLAARYGTVGSVNGRALDAPLVFSDGRIPIPDWRGQDEGSVYADGTPADCGTQLTAGCEWIDWPAQWEGMTLRGWAGAQDPGQTYTWRGSFPGTRRDGTGLLYRRNRYYDPVTGRFTQVDPIGLAGGVNAYGFAEGDPVNFIDPFGLSPVDSIPNALQKKLGDICAAVDCNSVNIITEASGGFDAVVMSGVRKTGRAVTLGTNIYVPSAPDPQNASDVALVAHELTHVFQFKTLQTIYGPLRGAATYFTGGLIDQARYSLRVGNPYTGAGFLEPMAQRVQTCFRGGSCVGSIFTPPK